MKRTLLLLVIGFTTCLSQGQVLNNRLKKAEEKKERVEAVKKAEEKAKKAEEDKRRRLEEEEVKLELEKRLELKRLEVKRLEEENKRREIELHERWAKETRDNPSAPFPLPVEKAKSSTSVTDALLLLCKDRSGKKLLRLDLSDSEINAVTLSSGEKIKYRNLKSARVHSLSSVDLSTWKLEHIGLPEMIAGSDKISYVLPDADREGKSLTLETKDFITATGKLVDKEGTTLLECEYFSAPPSMIQVLGFALKNKGN